jgi:hypothetical protein
MGRTYGLIPVVSCGSIPAPPEMDSENALTGLPIRVFTRLISNLHRLRYLQYGYSIWTIHVIRVLGGNCCAGTCSSWQDSGPSRREGLGDPGGGMGLGGRKSLIVLLAFLGALVF